MKRYLKLGVLVLFLCWVQPTVGDQYNHYQAPAANQQEQSPDVVFSNRFNLLLQRLNVYNPNSGSKICYKYLLMAWLQLYYSFNDQASQESAQGGQQQNQNSGLSGQLGNEPSGPSSGMGLAGQLGNEPSGPSSGMGLSGQLGSEPGSGLSGQVGSEPTGGSGGGQSSGGFTGFGGQHQANNQQITYPISTSQAFAGDPGKYYFLAFTSDGYPLMLLYEFKAFTFRIC